MGIKTACIGCKYRHDYHKRKLTKQEAWCKLYSKMVRRKRGCIDRQEPDTIPIK